MTEEDRPSAKAIWPMPFGGIEYYLTFPTLERIMEWITEDEHKHHIALSYDNQGLPRIWCSASAAKCIEQWYSEREKERTEEQ